MSQLLNLAHPARSIPEQCHLSILRPQLPVRLEEFIVVACGAGESESAAQPGELGRVNV